MEEAKLDDLFMLIASEASQELHKLMIAMHKIRLLKKEEKNGEELQTLDEANIDKELLQELLQALDEADVVRRLRQRHEKEFFNLPDNFADEIKRTHIGEEGCDFKHCAINFFHCLELAQKELRLATKDEKNAVQHRKNAINLLRQARIYRDMAFNIRDFIMEEMSKVKQPVVVREG